MFRSYLTATLTLILFMAFAAVFPVFGQGILNTEKYEQNLKKAFSLGGTFGYEGARGNSDLNKTDFEFFSSYKIQSHIFRFVGGFNYLNSSGETITSDIYGQVRYNHVFTGHLQSFTFYQLQKNEILLVKRRELAGAGLRIALLKKDSARIRLDAGIGGMYENELLKSTAQDQPYTAAQNYFRMTDFLSFRYVHKTIRVVDVMYYQPLVKSFTDFRIYNDLSVQFGIRKHLTFETGFVWRYDSRPPGSLKKQDLNLKNGIVLNF